MQRHRAAVAFLSVLGLITVPLAALLVAMDRFDLHLLANSWHPAWADVVMPPATHLADGVTVLVVGVVVLFRRSLRDFLLYAFASVGTALVVQGLKHLVFDEVRRPGHYLERMPDLQLVDGVVLHHFNSFPSGHASAAFAMCFALAVIFGGRVPGGLFALLAALLAYTRVYLSQHFMADVLAGAVLGTVIATVAYALLYRGPWRHSGRLDRRAFGQRNQ
jgi:membrane-associated phospholipid phosphatase